MKLIPDYNSNDSYPKLRALVKPISQTLSKPPVVGEPADADGSNASVPIKCVSCGLQSAAPHGSDLECIAALRAEVARLVAVLRPLLRQSA